MLLCGMASNKRLRRALFPFCLNTKARGRLQVVQSLNFKQTTGH